MHREMTRFLLVMSFLLLATPVVAHELTPTYPKINPAYVDGLLVAQLSIFNARKDVDYYEIGVFDKDWKPIPFATTTKILNVPYTGKINFEVYFRKEDQRRAVYVCTLSKLRSDEDSYAIVSSKVCSRLDGEPS